MCLKIKKRKMYRRILSNLFVSKILSLFDNMYFIEILELIFQVVEFASLDVCKSPVEKIHCLCTTFDLVYAELKTAIVEMISKSSGITYNKVLLIKNVQLSYISSLFFY